MLRINQDHLKVLLQVKMVTRHNLASFHHLANRPIWLSLVFHISQVNPHNRRNLFTRVNLLSQVSPFS